MTSPAAPELPGVSWAVLPPLREWQRFVSSSEGRRFAGHMALKRRGRGWEGFAEAIAWETLAKERCWLPGGYTAVPADAVPRIMARLGDNASRVTVRPVKGPEPQVPPGGPSGRYEARGKDWRAGKGHAWLYHQNP